MCIRDRPQRDADGVGETVDAVLETPPGLFVKEELLGHGVSVLSGRCAAARMGAAGVWRSRSGDLRSALDHREDVLGADDQEVLAVKLEFRAGVLRVEDRVAALEVHLFALAVVEDPARADRLDLALLGLLFRGIRDHQATLGRLFARTRLNDHLVTQRTELLRGWRRGGPTGRLRGTGGFDLGGGSHGWFLLRVCDRTLPARHVRQRTHEARYSLRRTVVSVWYCLDDMSINTTATPPAHLTSTSY